MRTSWLTTIFNLSLVFCFGLLGCDKGIKKKFGEPPNLKITSETQIDYLTVYYFSLPSCMRCHIDRLDPNLSTYESLKAEISHVVSTINSGKMPPTGDGFEPLSACQKLVLSTWIARGMPAQDGGSLGASGNACY